MLFEGAHSEVKALVDQFKASEKYFLSNNYQEAEVRKDFIDRFFIALGWDVLHQSQKNPYEQEVKVERGVDVSGAQKRADYSFALHPNFRDPKFFVEAKKPARNLTNKDYYFQTVRYGWHKTTPLVILTDFEEFHILDCRFSPDINTILSRQVKKYHYSEYIDDEKFAEIYWLLSREAILNNSLEKFAEGLPKPKGKAYQKALFAYEKHLTIDDAFLEEIDGIRVTLAKAFKKNDGSLNSEELTEATQRTIDRLVFIRFLEDKLIEPQHYVSTFGERGSAWGDFIALCLRLDAKYNGIVFKKSFIDSSNFKGPVDSEFHEICQNICHLNSRFLFNEIPIHILGSIYERFLGKVVHATAKGVTVEEKPEVRKAGGVYYTPKYIVDYIVQNTVGKRIENKTPEQIAKMRFADIACGSGSFLIGVLDCLLDYHNKYYQLHADRAKRDGCLYKDGLWVLSIKKKQDILRNNIYGVDIDSQAVEVTQLSLSLKMLEDETTATANEMQVLFHEKILPDMSKNIVCGNSLIGTDILSQKLFSTESERKLNPMDFGDAFKGIMQNGGFDAVVGNPPYVDSEEMVKSSPDERVYCAENYQAAKGNWDLYCVFTERAISLLNHYGLFGYILPNKFLSAPYGEYLRNFCSNYSVREIIDYSSVSVFVSNGKKINVYPIILIVSNNGKHRDGTYTKMVEDPTIRISYKKGFKIKPNDLNWTRKFDLLEPIILKIGRVSGELSNYFNLESAATVSEAYEIKKLLKDQDSDLFNNFQFVNTGTIDRYLNLWDITRTQYIKGSYFKPVVNRNSLKKIYPRRYDQAISEKLILAGMVTKLEAIYDSGNCLAGKSTVVVTKLNEKYSLKYLLGIMNSRLYSKLFRITNKHNAMAGGFLNVNKNNLSSLPFKEIDFKNALELEIYNRIVQLVDQLVDAKRQLLAVKTDKDKAYYERKCASLDSIIDVEVYKLYGLTEDEIRIVEASTQ